MTVGVPEYGTNFSYSYNEPSDFNLCVAWQPKFVTIIVLCRHLSVNIRSASVKFIIEAIIDGLNNASALLILMSSCLPILLKR